MTRTRGTPALHFLDGLPLASRAIAYALRGRIRSSVPGVEEEVRAGRLHWIGHDELCAVSPVGEALRLWLPADRGVPPADSPLGERRGRFRVIRIDSLSELGSPRVLRALTQVVLHDARERPLNSGVPKSTRGRRGPTKGRRTPR